MVETIPQIRQARVRRPGHRESRRSFGTNVPGTLAVEIEAAESGAADAPALYVLTEV